MWTRAKLAEVFKLQGESDYGKLIDALERQKRVIYTNDKKVVDRELRIASFSDLDELWQAGSRVSQPIRAGREDHSVSAGKAENA